MDKHGCEAIVVTCIDFRFQDLINEWIKDRLGSKNHDRVALAGGVKEFDTILNQVDISKSLHGITKVIFINHEDCGAYGVEGTEQKHAADLKSAASRVQEKYPDLAVEAFYLKLDNSFKRVV